MFEILNRYTKAVIYKADCEDLVAAIKLAVSENVSLEDANLYGASLDGANLTRANLYGANLDGANLTRANLYGANLTRASLDGANLYGASLTRASLDGANLYGANLTRASLTRASLDGANLYGASLYGASLYGANLKDDTRLPTGETFAEYKAVILPALIAAGGVSLATVGEAWTCHEWSNCPMHAAFNFDGNFDREGVPPLVKLLRPRIEQFVQLFDAKLLPNPLETAEKVSQ